MRRRTAFISANARVELTELRRALNEENVESIAPYDVNPRLGSLADTVVDAIRDASFVLVVITDEPIPPAVLFEAGVASALGRPLAVLDSRTLHGSMAGANFALASLVSAPTLSASLSDPTGLRHEVHSFLSGVLDEWSPQGSHPAAQQLATTGAIERADEAERRCAEALLKRGVSVVLHPGGGRGVPDMAASLPGLGPLFDPILVEVTGLRARLSEKRKALTDALTKAGAHLGLLVALDEVPLSTELTSATTAIVSVSLRQLEQSEVLSLQRWLTLARNRLVHGG
jgi:hypothetical protein